MISLSELLHELRKIGISISLEKNDLKVKFNGKALPADIINKIKDNKELIIHYLTMLSGLSGDDIVKAAESVTCYPLSSSQLRLWILSQFEEANIAYMISNVYAFEGNVNIEAMQYAFTTLIDRHEVLRTAFRVDADGEIKQYILDVKEAKLVLGCHDLRQEKDAEKRVQELIQQQMNTPFDLSDGVLLKADLYQVSANKWIFFCAMHHIVSDGSSIRILFRDLLAFYNAYTNKKPTLIPALRFQFKDYVMWLQKQLSEEKLKEHKEFWLQRFAEGIPALDLSKKKRPAIFSYKGDIERFVINEGETANVLRLTARYNGTLFMTLLYVIKILLHKYTRSARIMVGTSLDGRDLEGLEDQIGLYLNNLPLITQIDGNCNLKEFYGRVKATVLDTLHHKMYPLDLLINEINYKIEPGRPGLFNVLVELHTDTGNGQFIQPNGFTVYPYGRQFTISNFDLSFDFVKRKETIHVLITYSTDLFERNEILLMKERFGRLLNVLTSEPDENRLIDDISFLTKAEDILRAGSLTKFKMKERF